MQPLHSYLVCATPRSGSTLFCEVLGNTGIAGRPKEYFEELRATGLPRQPQEYFEDPGNEEILDVLGNPPHRVSPRRLAQWQGAAYLQCLQEYLEEGTTPNGIFGAKMMWAYFGDFLSNLRQVPGYAEPDTRQLLDRVFPDLRYIFITRQDKVRQAVSLWKAIQTQIWRKNVVPLSKEASILQQKQLVFHFGAINHLVRQIEAHEVAWGQYFRESGIEPLVVVYEAMVEALETTVQEILRYLAIPIPETLRLPHHGMERQADVQSEEWVQRYHALKQVSPL